jgi:hypothetical protein
MSLWQNDSPSERNPVFHLYLRRSNAVARRTVHRYFQRFSMRIALKQGRHSAINANSLIVLDILTTNLLGIQSGSRRTKEEHR